MKADNNTREHLQKENMGDYLTIEQTAAFLGLRVSRLRNMVFKKQIPYLKVGASVRFNKVQLVEWINSKLQVASNV